MESFNRFSFNLNTMFNLSFKGYAGTPLLVEDSQIGIATFGIDHDCQGINAMTSIRRHIRWIEKNKSLLESKVLVET